jgi:hypothetical protein
MAKKLKGQQPQGQEPQTKGQQLKGQEPQTKGQQPKGKKPQGQEPQKKGQQPKGQQPKGQQPKGQKLTQDEIIKKSWYSIKKPPTWKIIVAVFIAVGVIVGIIILFMSRKEKFSLPPKSMDELVNPITQAKNKYNIYNRAGNYVLNSNNWSIQNENGLYGTDTVSNAGNPGTNFTFLYPVNEKSGAQIVNDKGYCLDTNTFQPGNNPNIISQSWWWNPQCFSTALPSETLLNGQVGFKLNKNNQLEFGKSGMCLDMSSSNKKNMCEGNEYNTNTLFTIEQEKQQAQQQQAQQQQAQQPIIQDLEKLKF